MFHYSFFLLLFIMVRLFRFWFGLMIGLFLNILSYFLSLLFYVLLFLYFFRYNTHFVFSCFLDKLFNLFHILLFWELCLLAFLFLVFYFALVICCWVFIVNLRCLSSAWSFWGSNISSNSCCWGYRLSTRIAHACCFIYGYSVLCNHFTLVTVRVVNVLNTFFFCFYLSGYFLYFFFFFLHCIFAFSCRSITVNRYVLSFYTWLNWRNSIMILSFRGDKFLHNLP